MVIGYAKNYGKENLKRELKRIKDSSSTRTEMKRRIRLALDIRTNVDLGNALSRRKISKEFQKWVLIL